MSTVELPPRPLITGYRCERCSYGIAMTRPPDVRCPMCGSTGWRPELRPKERSIV